MRDVPRIEKYGRKLGTGADAELFALLLSFRTNSKYVSSHAFACSHTPLVATLASRAATHRPILTPFENSLRVSLVRKALSVSTLW